MGEAEVEQEHSETEPICVNSGQAVYAQQSLWSGLIWYFKFISRDTFKFESVFSFQHAFFVCLFVYSHSKFSGSGHLQNYFN